MLFSISPLRPQMLDLCWPTLRLLALAAREPRERDALPARSLGYYYYYYYYYSYCYYYYYHHHDYYYYYYYYSYSSSSSYYYHDYD